MEEKSKDQPSKVGQQNAGESRNQNPHQNGKQNNNGSGNSKAGNKDSAGSGHRNKNIDHRSKL